MRCNKILLLLALLKIFYCIALSHYFKFKFSIKIFIFMILEKKFNVVPLTVNRLQILSRKISKDNVILYIFHEVVLKQFCLNIGR